MTRPVRIANCSGFYGDRLAAAREMLDQGSTPIDVLTGDYLARLAMLILWKARRKDPGLGYATTFLKQMEDVLGTCLQARVGWDRGALPGLLLVGFPDPPAAPGVRLSPHRALHVP